MFEEPAWAEEAPAVPDPRPVPLRPRPPAASHTKVSGPSRRAGGPRSGGARRAGWGRAAAAPRQVEGPGLPKENAVGTEGAGGREVKPSGFLGREKHVRSTLAQESLSC